MADSISTFLSKTVKMTEELQHLEHRTVEIGAQAVKDAVLSEMKSAGVKDNRLRGVGKKGTKVGVHYAFGDEKTAIVRATGPFHLIERGTRPHRIPKEVRGKRARRRVFFMPGIGFRAFANHPGTKGKHPWNKGVVRAVPDAQKAWGAALAKTVVKAYQ
jgi:hypothetical protein